MEFKNGDYGNCLQISTFGCVSYPEATKAFLGLSGRTLDAFCPIPTAYQAIRVVAAARALSPSGSAEFLLTFHV